MFVGWCLRRPGQVASSRCNKEGTTRRSMPRPRVRKETRSGVGMKASKLGGELPIRRALRNRYLRHYRTQGEVLVLDELGLAHARSRVDIAVINGHVHGYEIKSAVDKLDRLPRQLDIYRMSLQRLTLVVAPRHLDTVATTVPKWCGILEVVQGPRGGIGFRCVQQPRTNPDMDPFMLAHLLWREEALAALAELGAARRDLKGTRKDLYRLLLEVISVSELTALIKRSMLQRRSWRDLQLPA